MYSYNASTQKKERKGKREAAKRYQVDISCLMTTGKAEQKRSHADYSYNIENYESKSCTDFINHPITNIPSKRQLLNYQLLNSFQKNLNH